jgi:eukaryotic-like serine/threonine-protein kinase
MYESSRVGEQVGNYRLLRLLGQSRFAEIYLGEHVQLYTQVAVKVVNGYWGKNDLDKFLAQAMILAYLEHPHIIRVFDFGVVDGSPFLVMDYAPHGTLRDLHPRGTRLPLDTIVFYVEQLADALQYVHQQKLIHRDIKPHNMLLGHNRHILLSDFGIAIVSHSLDPIYAGLYDFEGTVLYAAPEQLKGKPRRSSDQYALGVVVYEWLCGRWPFSGSFDEVVYQHLFVPPPSLQEQGLNIAPAVDEVVMKALAKTPEERFPSVEAFANALLRASQGEQVPVATHFQGRAGRTCQFRSPFPFPTT